MNTKRALVVVTSVTKYPDMNRPTGLWFGEVVHFADVLYKNGYKESNSYPLKI